MKKEISVGDVVKVRVLINENRDPNPLLVKVTEIKAGDDGAFSYGGIVQEYWKEEPNKGESIDFQKGDSFSFISSDILP
jgi:hypothetical protein